MAQEAKRPNVALAAALQTAGLSNTALANRVRMVAARHGVKASTDHVTVRRWIDGTQPVAQTARFIAEALGDKLGRTILPSELGLTAAPRDSSVSQALGEYHATAQRAVGALATLVLADAQAHVNASIDVDPGLWSGAVMGWLFERPATPVATRRVSLAEVRQVEAMAATFMDLDFKFGGGHARSLLSQYFHGEVLPLLHDVSGDASGRALLSAAASVTQLLAWTAYDMGWHQRAQQYMAQGLRLAQEADDHMLGARFLANMSHQATYLGRFREARQLAMAAFDGARGHATPTVLALLLAMQARASAAAGDSRDAALALSGAEKMLQRTSPGDDPAWIAYFDRSELAGEAAHCFRDLRQPRSAAPFIAEALELTPAHLTRTRAFIGLVQAASCLHAKDIDGCCDHTLKALTDGQGLKSERYRRYVRDVVADLAPYQGAVGVDMVTTMACQALAS